MNFIAIDYGLRKIGLALSEGFLAEPLPVLKVKNSADAKTKLISIIRLHSVGMIVFGLPRPDSIGAGKFADNLESTLGIPLVRIDETLTTNLGKKKLKKTEAEDSAAAAILLQEFLDQQKGT